MSYFSALLLTVQDPQVQQESTSFGFVLMFVNIMPMVVGFFVVVKVALLPIATIMWNIYRRHHGYKGPDKHKLAQLEDLLVVNVVSAENLRKTNYGQVQGVHVQAFWNGELMGKTRSDKKEYYQPRFDDRRLKCLFPKDVAGCVLKIVVNHETGAGMISFLGQVEFTDRDLCDLPTEAAPYMLKPRIGQNAQQVCGSVTLAFITTNIGWAKAKELQKIGKLAGRRESLLEAAEHIDMSKAIGSKELLHVHELFLQVNGAEGLLKHDAGTHAMVDPYCTVYWSGEEVLRTPVIKHTATPLWDGQSVQIPLPKLTIDLFDHDKLTSDTFLGQVTIEGEALSYPLSGVQERPLLRKWLGKSNSKQKAVQGVLNLEMKVVKALQIEVCSAKGLMKTNTFSDGCDASCKIFWNDELVHETKTVKKSCAPVWEHEKTSVMVRGDIEEGRAKVKDRTKQKAVRTWRESTLRIEVWGTGHFLGEVSFEGEQLGTLSFAKKSFDLVKTTKLKDGKGKKIKLNQKHVDGKGQLFVKFAPVELLQVQLMSARDLAKVDLFGSCDPYYMVHYNGVELGRSTPQKKTRTPVWPNAVFTLPLQEVRFVLRDHNSFGSMHLGKKKSDFLGQAVLTSNHSGDFSTNIMSLELRSAGENEMVPVQGSIKIEVDMLLKLRVQVVDCTALHELDDRAQRAFYVVMLWDDVEIGRTTIAKGSLNPLWKDEFIEVHVPSKAPASAASWDEEHRFQKELTLQVWNKKSGLSALHGDAFHGHVCIPAEEIVAHDYTKYELERAVSIDHDQELMGGALGLQIYIDGGGLLEHGRKIVADTPTEGHFSIMDVLSAVPVNPLSQIALEVAGAGTGKLARSRAKKNVASALQDNSMNPDALLPIMRKDAILASSVVRRASAEEDDITSSQVRNTSTVMSPLSNAPPPNVSQVEVFRVAGGKASKAVPFDAAASRFRQTRDAKKSQKSQSSLKAQRQIQGAMDMLKGRTGGSVGAIGGTGRAMREQQGTQGQRQNVPVMNPIAQPLAAVPLTVDFDQWLQANKLDAVKAELAKSGIGDMEDLSELEQSDLQHLGISHFHQKRLARILFFPEKEKALRAALQNRREEEEQDQRLVAQAAKREQDVRDPFGVRKSKQSFVGHGHAKRVDRRLVSEEGAEESKKEESKAECLSL